MAENKKRKLIGFGFKDILNFLGKGKQREDAINQAGTHPAPQEYPVNHMAKLRHPYEQVFIIRDIISHGGGCFTYKLARKDGKTPALFRAGQYVVVREMIDGKRIARPITISSGIEDAMKGYMSLTVKALPNGFFSPYVTSHWKVGDEVHTSGPQGNFYYSSLRDEKHVIAVSGGGGITPFLSMALSIASGDEDFELDVVYGVNCIEEVMFMEQWQEIMKRTDKVRLHIMSKEPSEKAEFSGYISKEIIEKLANQQPFSIFACGPQPMYVHLDSIAEALNIDQKHYRKEIFGSPKDPTILPGYKLIQTDRPLKATIKIATETFEIPMDPNETIMTALERAGIAGPNRCRGGICGYCRSKLLSGEVYVPEGIDGRRIHDKERGYIHPCCCFPLSDIVLEMPNNR